MELGMTSWCLCTHSRLLTPGHGRPRLAFVSALLSCTHARLPCKVTIWCSTLNCLNFLISWLLHWLDSMCWWIHAGLSSLYKEKSIIDYSLPTDIHSMSCWLFFYQFIVALVFFPLFYLCQGEAQCGDRYLFILMEWVASTDMWWMSCSLCRHIEWVGWFSCFECLWKLHRWSLLLNR